MADDHEPTNGTPPRKSAEEQANQRLAMGIGFGLCLGAGFGIALGNTALGIGAGLAIGVAIGVSGSRSKD